MLDTQNCLQNMKNDKSTIFFSQLAFYTSKGHTCKVFPFYLYDFFFIISFIISSVVHTRLSTFYAYLITIMGNRNLNFD